MIQYDVFEQSGCTVVQFIVLILPQMIRIVEISDPLCDCLCVVLPEHRFDERDQWFALWQRLACWRFTKRVQPVRHERVLQVVEIISKFANEFFKGRIVCCGCIQFSHIQDIIEIRLIEAQLQVGCDDVVFVAFLRDVVTCCKVVVVDRLRKVCVIAVQPGSNDWRR